MTTLKLIKIKKNYGSKKVLDGIDSELSNGVYGLLGANGEGKTTLFNIITGYDKKSGGSIVYPSYDNKKDVLIGILPQHFVGYPEMTVDEFLHYIASVKGNWNKNDCDDDISEKLKIFNLSSVRNKKIKKLSGGQVRRLGLVQAFLLNPRIILLDEPTTGLDPKERLRFKDYIVKMGKKHTILISTHIVSDLETITDKVFILKGGKFVEEGHEQEIIKKLSGKVWELDNNDIKKLSIEDSIVVNHYNKNGREVVRVISNNKNFSSDKLTTPTLEDLYLLYFNKEW